jgi:hypothetical protein
MSTIPAMFVPQLQRKTPTKRDLLGTPAESCHSYLSLLIYRLLARRRGIKELSGDLEMNVHTLEDWLTDIAGKRSGEGLAFGYVPGGQYVNVIYGNAPIWGS